ncbi:MAG: hypothetical protein U0350_08495 [Caldilineaceae bacterium]
MSSTPDMITAAIDQLWDYGQPAETEKRFRDLLATLEPASSAYQELLTQIARTQGLQRNFAEAHQTLDEVASHLTAQPLRVHLRYLLERGRTLNSSGHPDAARPLFLDAWEAASVAGEDFYAVDAAHMLGIIEPPAEQLAWNEKALALAESSSDSRAQKWLGSLYNNIGWTYHDLQQDETALAIFQKALAWRTAQGQTNETRIAKWCVARILRALNRVTEALAMQQALQQEFAASGDADGYVHEELGECLLLLQQPEQAQPHFATAYQRLSQDPWLQANEKPRLERLQTLGKVFK